MDIKILVDAGLTEPEATTYKLLVENSPISPPGLADISGETRTNMYKLLENLEDMGLAKRDEAEKKIRYWALNPTALLSNVEKIKQDAELRVKKVSSAMDTLVSSFIKHNEQPGVRFYYGSNALLSVYEDQLKDRNKIYFIRSVHDANALEIDGLHKMRNRFPAENVEREAIIQDYLPYVIKPEDQMHVADSDKLMKLTRNWIKKEDYQSPVEWSVYGNKVGIVTFGKEIVSMIIDNQQIASSFLEIFNLIKKTSSQLPEYRALPKNAIYTKIPSSRT